MNSSAQANSLLALTLGVVGLWVGTPLLSQPTPQIAERDLLDVGIVALDPGTEKKSIFLTGYEYISPELRQSEALFIAVHLMRTLQKTRSFGLVRMMPSNSVSADLYVTGRIRESSGRRLEVDLEVLDATGRRWLKRIYKQKARTSSYALAFHTNVEPFQEVYDQFAADLVAAQSRKKSDHLEDVRHVAELRFAAQLAPGIFGDYLKLDRKRRIKLGRLPSRDDPMLARIRTIQTRDEVFLDLLTDRYQGFYAAMNRPYDDFRATRYGVEFALRDARAQHNLANAQSLFAPDNESAMDRNRAAELASYFRRQVAKRTAYLDRMSRTFTRKLDPLRLELDGEVIRFEGTIENQYRQWQKLLENIFETETGMSAKSKVFAEDLNTSH